MIPNETGTEQRTWIPWFPVSTSVADWPTSRQWTDRKKTSKQKELNLCFDGYSREKKHTCKKQSTFCRMKKNHKPTNKKPNPCSPIPLNLQRLHLLLSSSCLYLQKGGCSSRAAVLGYESNQVTSGRSPSKHFKYPSATSKCLKHTDISYPSALKDSSNPIRQAHRRVI